MPNVALSRAEKIILAKLNNQPYTNAPLSRLEELLIGLNTGSGESTDKLTRDILEVKKTVDTLDQYITKNATDISGVKSSVVGVQNKVMNLESSVNELNLNIVDIHKDVIDIEDHAIMDSKFAKG